MEQEINIISNHSDLVKNTRLLMKTHLIVGEETPYPRQATMSAIFAGGPGTGKSYAAKFVLPAIWATVNGVATKEVKVITMRCSDRDAAEFAGLTMPAKKAINGKEQVVTTTLIPDLLTQLTEARESSPEDVNGGKGYKYILLLLDEVMQASADVQKTLSSLFDRTDNTLGGHDLGAGIFVVGTGNTLADKSGAQKLLSHLRNRVAYFVLEGYNINTITNWRDKYATPRGLVIPLVQLVMDVAGEQGDKETNKLFDEVVPSEDRSICSFRSITNVSRILATYFEQDGVTGALTVIPIDSSTGKLIASIVGPKAATIIREYFANICDGVPTEGEILNDPEKANVPDSMGGQSVAGNRALALATTADNTDAAIIYVTRLRNDLQVQLGARLIRKSTELGNVFTSSRAIQFIREHGDLVALAEELAIEIGDSI